MSAEPEETAEKVDDTAPKAREALAQLDATVALLAAELLEG